MPFQVLENNHPADCNSFNVHNSWNQSAYETLQEAQEYANKWLGAYQPKDPLQVDEEYYYSGSDDFVVIREVK